MAASSPFPSMRRFLSSAAVALFVLCNYDSILQLNSDSRRLSTAHNIHQQHSDDLKALYKADGFHHISRDYGLMYVHIPKTGGSTVEYSSVFEEKRTLGGTVPRSHHSVRKLRQSPSLQPDDYTVATHIRDPCERFVSAFHYVRFDNRSVGFRPEIELFGLFNHTSIESAVSWLDETDQWAKLKRRIFHFKDMLNWVLLEDPVSGDHSFGVDVVMCQDQWTEGVHRLFDQLGIQAVPDDLFERKLAATDVSISNGSTQQERQQMTARSKNKKCQSLPRETRVKIFDAYAMDSCVFGYGRYGVGKFAIEGRDNTVTGQQRCIGSQFDREWFTKRYHFCRETLKKDVGELKGR